MKTLLKWTVTEYHHLINTGILVDRQTELLHGEIVEMSPESPIHTQITETTVEYLRFLLKGLAYIREAHPITLSNSEPQPDIAIVYPPRNNYRQRHPYPEDILWLIEVANTTLTYFRRKKASLCRSWNFRILGSRYRKSANLCFSTS